MLSGICMIINVSTLLWILHCFAIFTVIWSTGILNIYWICTTPPMFRPTAEVCHTIRSMKLCRTRGCRAGRRVNVRLRRRRMTPGQSGDSQWPRATDPGTGILWRHIHTTGKPADGFSVNEVCWLFHYTAADYKLSTTYTYRWRRRRSALQTV